MFAIVCAVIQGRFRQHISVFQHEVYVLMCTSDLVGVDCRAGRCHTVVLLHKKFLLIP